MKYEIFVFDIFWFPLFFFSMLENLAHCVRAKLVAVSVCASRRYARCKRCRLIIGLADYHGSYTMLSIQRVHVERSSFLPGDDRRSLINRKTNNDNRSPKQNNEKKDNFRVVDADDWSTVSNRSEQKTADLADFESVYSPGRGNVYSPSVDVPHTLGDNVNKGYDDSHNGSLDENMEVFPHTPGAYAEKENNNSEISVQPEIEYDDISSTTDDILDANSVDSIDSSSVYVMRDIFDRLLNCKRKFPRPGSVVSIDTWSDVFKDLLEEPRAFNGTVVVEEWYFNHLLGFEENYPAPGCAVDAATYARLFSADTFQIRANDEYYMAEEDECEVTRKINEGLSVLRLFEKERKDAFLKMNFGAPTSHCCVETHSTVNVGASTSHSRVGTHSTVNVGASTSHNCVEPRASSPETSEKFFTDTENTISVSQSMIDHEIALDVANDIDFGLSPSESVGFDAELFERYLNSVADEHTETDASKATDNIISDNVNNDVNMGVPVEENEDGKKRFIFRFSFIYTLFFFFSPLFLPFN